jgi:glycerate-2-kinase
VTTGQVKPVTGDAVAGSRLRGASAELLARVLSNTPDLLDGPHARLRRTALEVAVEGLSAADPGPVTRRVVTFDASSDTLSVDGLRYPLNERGRIFVVGAGKASYPIAVALHDILGSRLAGGVVAVRDPSAATLPRLRIICADHPLPTGRSTRAAEEILDCVRAATVDDIVITCFTGGSSALSSLAPETVSAADKRTLHQQLLSSGLSITDINTVRKQVSAVKGGRVALAASPATVINLTVSDVAGSPLDAVTDPVVQDTSKAADARSVLQGAHLWDVVPPSVREHLERDLPTPTLEHNPQTVMLADGAGAVTAMVAAARERGYHPVTLDHEVEGDADEVGATLARLALDEASRNRSPVIVVGCGGEAVVTVTQDSEFGKGGPNQQAALRAAEILEDRAAAALFIDSDGSDGGTAFAGALVDGATIAKARATDLDIVAARQQLHATAACETLDLAVQTGHTGTNVNDLFVVLAELEARA